MFFILWGQISLGRSWSPTTAHYRMIRFVSNVSFLHKARLKRGLRDRATGHAHLVLDGTRARTIDPDILDTLRELESECAKNRGLQLLDHA